MRERERERERERGTNLPMINMPSVTKSISWYSSGASAGSIAVDAAAWFPVSGSAPDPAPGPSPVDGTESVSMSLLVLGCPPGVSHIQVVVTIVVICAAETDQAGEKRAGWKGLTNVGHHVADGYLGVRIGARPIPGCEWLTRCVRRTSAGVLIEAYACSPCCRAVASSDSSFRSLSGCGRCS